MRAGAGGGAGAADCLVLYVFCLVQTLRRRSVTARDPLHNSRWFCLSLLLMLIYRPEERELSPAFKLPDVSASSPRSCRVRGAGYPGSGSVQQPTHLVSLDLTSAVVSLRT